MAACPVLHDSRTLLVLGSPALGSYFGDGKVTRLPREPGRAGGGSRGLYWHWPWNCSAAPHPQREEPRQMRENPKCRENRNPKCQAGVAAGQASRDEQTQGHGAGWAEMLSVERWAGDQILPLLGLLCSHQLLGCSRVL